MKNIFALVLLVFSSCADIDIYTTYDHDADFSHYETWCWMNGCEPSYEGPRHLDSREAKEAIANAIALAMHNKGYTMANDTAQLMVDFHIIMQEDSVTHGFVHEEDLQYWPFYENEDYYHFLVGTLVIDIADRPSGRLIWTGKAQKYLSLYPRMSEQEINSTIARILSTFPPEKP